jgi:hypothetical protein
MLATADSWASFCPFSVACRLTSSACAWASCRSASSAASSRSELDSSRITVSAFTTAPGFTGTFSTRALVLAASHWISSGTRVPCPSTSRSMGPRRTVSIQTVPFSTEGAAGRSRRRPTLTPITTITPATA